jgi:hypothetical protein
MHVTDSSPQQCAEGSGNLPGIHDVWFPKELESLNPVGAAKFLFRQGEGLAKSLPNFGNAEAAHRSDPPSECPEEPATPPDRLTKKPCEIDTAAGHSSDKDDLEAWETTDRDLEAWELIRDALLSWEGPERPRIDEWRQLLCRKTFIMRWLHSCRGDGATTHTHIHLHERSSLFPYTAICELPVLTIPNRIVAIIDPLLSSK